MSYNLELREKAFAGEVNIFDSEKIRWVTGGVTLDVDTVAADEKGRRFLPIGTPLGKITATGKYGPYDGEAEDGRETPVLMLGETVDFSLGNGEFGDQVATAFDWARVITERLPIAAGDLAAVKAALPNITFL